MIKFSRFLCCFTMLALLLSVLSIDAFAIDSVINKIQLLMYNDPTRNIPQEDLLKPANGEIPKIDENKIITEDTIIIDTKSEK